MARRRDAHGRFLKKHNPARRRSPARRRVRHAYAHNPVRRAARRAPARRRARRNPYFAANPRRHRRARRNPPLFGGNKILGMSFAEIGYAGLGFVAPPMLEGLAKGYLPAALTSNTFGKYGVKIAAVAGLSYIGRKFLGQEAGKYIAIGGVTYLVASLVIEFVPGIFSGFSGYMNPGASFGRKMLPRGKFGAQPFLGMYQGTSVATSRVPERLDPASRF